MEEIIQAYMEGWDITREKAKQLLFQSGYQHMPSQEYLDQEANL